ncbi:transposase [Accumulibacter sp.]|uniref:transposase n=1 Tax=Accumulibacter sp. TaxID=2053492 RepID=UPI001A511779|nr:transposase [Accumulibacter sp.]MBL8401253.1 transposase [Accumulibacter sp.]
MISADGDSLFTCVRWPRSKSPKRAESLANLERLLPWDDLEKIVRGVYLSDKRSTGRPGYPAMMLLRCLVVRWFWNLSDDQTEAVILDSYATARFIGTDPWKPKPPSASLIRGFRKHLDFHGVLNDIKSKIDACFNDAGIKVWCGLVREPVFKRTAARVVPESLANCASTGND